LFLPFGPIIFFRWFCPPTPSLTGAFQKTGITVFFPDYTRVKGRKGIDIQIGKMRRRAGIGGLQTAAAARDQYKKLGENVAKIRTDLMKEHLSTFRSQLQDFATKHKVAVPFFTLFLSLIHNANCWYHWFRMTYARTLHSDHSFMKCVLKLE
jgi:hypothetical protein